MSSVTRCPTSRISPPQPAARSGVLTPLWEARVSGYWSHAEVTLNVAPVYKPQSDTDDRIFDWGGYVYVKNVTTGDLTNGTLVRTAKPHVTLIWGPESEFSDGDLLQIVVWPHGEARGKAAIWVNSAFITLFDSLPPALATPSDPEFTPPPLGFDEALFDRDTFR